MIHRIANVLFQLSLLLSLAAAAPLSVENHNNHWQTWHYGAGGGVIGFIVLILDIIVFSKYLLQQTSSDSGPPFGLPSHPIRIVLTCPTHS